MADELEERLYRAVLANAEGSSLRECMIFAAREALRWRDETRPQQPAAAVPEGDESPAIGDYVLGTKYSDGDPGDPWAVGIYAGIKDGRHVVTHHDGTPIYAKGFKRVGKITQEQGRDMLKVSRGLESAGGSLWAMLAAAERKGNDNG